MNRNDYKPSRSCTSKNIRKGNTVIELLQIIAWTEKKIGGMLRKIKVNTKVFIIVFYQLVYDSSINCAIIDITYTEAYWPAHAWVVFVFICWILNFHASSNKLKKAELRKGGVSDVINRSYYLKRIRWCKDYVKLSSVSRLLSYWNPPWNQKRLQEIRQRLLRCIGGGRSYSQWKWEGKRKGQR